LKEGEKDMGLKQLPATKLTANDATAKEELGRVRWEGNKAYKYILVEDMDIAKGDVVEYSDASGYEVTKDRSGGSSIGRVVAGVAIGTITDGQYGWIQIHGVHTTVKTDGGVAAGDALVPHASYDGKTDTATSASTVVITAAQTWGYALETDTTSASTATVTAAIRCM
jgi:hypothetical protein